MIILRHLYPAVKFTLIRRYVISARGIDATLQTTVVAYLSLSIRGRINGCPQAVFSSEGARDLCDTRHVCALDAANPQYSG